MKTIDELKALRAESEKHELTMLNREYGVYKEAFLYRGMKATVVEFDGFKVEVNFEDDYTQVYERGKLDVWKVKTSPRVDWLERPMMHGLVNELRIQSRKLFEVQQERIDKAIAAVKEAERCLWEVR